MTGKWPTGIGNRIFLYEKGNLVQEVTADQAESVLLSRIEVLARE